MSISLVPYQPEFVDAFIEWRDQASSLRHNPIIRADREKIVQGLEKSGADLSDLKKYDNFRWFVRYENHVVGQVNLKNINHMMSSAEIGYGIDEKFHGKGIATQAVHLLVDKAFAEAGLRKLIAYVHDQNLASCRVLEKLGFIREGLLREHFIINGRPENEVIFGVLRNEWCQSPQDIKP